MKKYFRHKIQNLLIVNKIITIHYFEFGRHFKHEEESHDFWEIVYADKGNIVCTSYGKEILLRHGEMIFHKPDEPHSLAADGQSAPNVFVICFECRSDVMRFFEGRKIRLTKKNVKYVYSIIEEAKKTFDMPFSDPDTKRMKLLPSPTLGGEQLIKNQLEIMLINIMRSLTETDTGNEIFLYKNQLDSKLVDEVISILENNVHSRISIDQIWSLISYSRAYIFKEFKQATGKSVMEYLTALKIEKAKQMLRETDMSVKEISESLCFDTPNYFSKTFKKFAMSTPTAYKKRAGV